MEDFKNSDQQDQYLKDKALQTCVDAGTLNACPNHEETYFSGPQELSDAFILADNYLLSGKLELPTGVSIKEFGDHIKDVYGKNSFDETCTFCDRMMADLRRIISAPFVE